MYSAYPGTTPPVHHNNNNSSGTVPVCTESSATAPSGIVSTSSSTLTSSTWSNNTSGSNHLGLAYTSFDPGPSTSSSIYGSHHQSGVFPFPAYPSMHMPFDYQQVAHNTISPIFWFIMYTSPLPPPFKRSLPQFFFARNLMLNKHRQLDLKL